MRRSLLLRQRRIVGRRGQDRLGRSCDRGASRIVGGGVRRRHLGHACGHATVDWEIIWWEDEAQGCKELEDQVRGRSSSYANQKGASTQRWNKRSTSEDRGKCA